MDFLPASIATYAEKFTTEEPMLLQELTRETWAKVLMPRMLSGHIQGRFLSLLSKLMQAKRILEVGTYTGYSAICLAEGLSIEGELISMDINDELNEMAQLYIEKAGYTKQIQLMNGNALELIPTLKGEFDIIFLDADKENYPEYYRLCKPLLRKGGVLMADNVLWSGKVTEQAKSNDYETMGLQKFVEITHADDEMECLLLPIRDGIHIVRRK